MRHEPVRTKQRIDQRATSSPISVDKRVNRFELRMSDCDLDKGWNVNTANKRHQISQRTFHTMRLWCHKVCTQRTRMTRTNPHHNLPQTPGMFGHVSLMLKQCTVHRKNCRHVKSTRKLQCRFHRTHVPHNQPGVGSRTMSQLRKTQLAGRGRQLLDLRT